MDQEPSTPTDDLICEICGGSGWLRRDLPVTDGRFGALVECRACMTVAQRRLAKAFHDAKVPERFRSLSFDTYPVTTKPQAEALAAVRRWVDDEEHEDIEPAEHTRRIAEWQAWRKNGLFLHGPYGVGKTGLALAVMRHEIEEMGEVALFVRVPELLDAIRATYSNGRGNGETTESELLEAVKNVPFLVLDDIGAERVTDWVREKLFTIINHRHDEMLCTVVTSNLSIPELAEHIGERTTWRLVEMCCAITIDGPNLRVQR